MQKKSEELMRSQAVIFAPPVNYGRFPVLSYLLDEPDIDHEHVGELPS